MSGLKALLFCRSWRNAFVRFYACSGNDNQIGYDVDSSRKMQVTFRDWTIENSDNFIPAEDNLSTRSRLRRILF